MNKLYSKLVHKLIYGDPSADNILIQMTGEHETAGLEQEYDFIRQISGKSDFCLTAIEVYDWNRDLSPWRAPAVFGNEDFDGGAENTLHTVLEDVIPDMKRNAAPSRIFIGGYSMAGLFALWSVYQSDVFAGAAAASPSVWFPGFSDYVRENPIRTDAVYLSLGDREEKTRNPILAQVGNAIRDIHTHLQDTGTRCVLEWNQGNHFKDPDIRMAKAFAWMLEESDRKDH